ncbi:MAG: hypothetical protein GXY34_10180 [Syntrophomonadaceae bacterium]|nr:hypothetical protein [Syntrophomonadaceae bacterium]
MILTAILAIAGALLYSADMIKDYYIKSRLDPRVEMTEAIKKTTEVKCFRYTLASGFTVDDRKEVISRVIGEKDHGNTHIKGEMVNTPVDIYYIDRTIYNYDTFSKHWLEIDSGTSQAEELLISELNPLSNFRFRDIGKIEKRGFEKIDGAECLVVECSPTVESQLLETRWMDFKYRLWIDYNDNWIRKGVLSATNKKTGKTRLYIETTLKDFNDKIEVKPPDTSKK